MSDQASTNPRPFDGILRGPDTQPRRPNNNCYWLIPGRFLAGEYPGYSNDTATAMKMARFLDAGVNFFIDLTEPHELHHYEAVLKREAAARGITAHYRRMSIRDVSVPTLDHMQSILDTIDAALAAGHGVYVHCWGGIGRTGTVVGCYMVRHGNSGPEALQEIARLWENMEKKWRVSRSPETDAQHNFVRNWEEQKNNS
jgi:protein-tyrosine phosphatase